MNPESDLPFDLEEISALVNHAEVLVIGFTLFPERLLIDMRTSPSEGPLLKIVSAVSSRAERLRDLTKLRPNFGLPNQLIFFIWPRSTASFKTSPTWKRIIERCVATSFPESAKLCEDVVQALHQLERQGLVEAIRGDTYQSLWESHA